MMMRDRKIKKYLTNIFVFIAAFVYILNAQAFAKDISFRLDLDRDQVEVGDMVQLGLVFENTQSMPAPQLPEIEGLRTQYAGPSTQMTSLNGMMSSSVTHRYRIVVMKTGTFTIGPFSFAYNGDNYTSPSATLTVVDRGQAPLQTSADVQSVDRKDDIDGRIFILLSCEKNKAYLNEPLEIKIKLYVNQLTVRGIEYPVLGTQGLVVEPFTQPLQYREQLSGKIYDVVEFKTKAYASVQGALTIGPVKIKAKVVTRQTKASQRSSFFGSDLLDDSFFGDLFGRASIMPVDVTSPETALNILPFPEENKPKEFTGAVGAFKMEVNAAPLELKAGDPITLNMKIRGTGNFDSVQSPVLSSLQGFKVYNAEAQKTVDDSKVFEQVIIPQNTEIKNIPAVKFAYFDPQKQAYFTEQNQPIALKVLPADEKVGVIIDTSKKAPALSSTQVLGQDIVYIKEDIGKIRVAGKFVYNNKGFLGFNLFLLLCFIGIVLFQARKERLTQDISYARKLRAPKIARAKLEKAKLYLEQNKKELFYEQIFKTLQEYLGHRFNRPSAGMTADVVEELILSQALDPRMGEKLKSCFSQCDMARYAAASLDQETMRTTLKVLAQAIDYLETHKK
ncbi:MAG: BatD family protein [Candidatus Omnitrophota bacterium]